MTGALTDSKIPGFTPCRDGSSPHYEVWYGKVDLPDQRALWFRYKTMDGVVSRASCWAVFFDHDDIVGGKTRWWLDDLRQPGPTGEGPETDIGPPLRFQERHAVFRTPGAHLDDANALGAAGPIQWDLHWRDSGRRFSFVPSILEDIGLARSTYRSCFTDLRVDGRIRCRDTTVELDDATGMIGHIQGKKIAGHSWAWSHCNNFDGDVDAAFEGLSARALIGNLGSPLMTGLVLFVDVRRYVFHGPVRAFATRSQFDRNCWTFNADNGDARLVGKVEAPDELAVVRYTDTDGSDLWCHNSKLGNLRLQLTDRRRGIDRTLRSSGRAAFETVSRQPPVEDVLV